MHGQNLTHTVVYAFPLLGCLSRLFICSHTIRKASVGYFLNKLVEFSLLCILLTTCNILIWCGMLVLLHIGKSAWLIHFYW